MSINQFLWLQSNVPIKHAQGGIRSKCSSPLTAGKHRNARNQIRLNTRCECVISDYNSISWLRTASHSFSSVTGTKTSVPRSFIFSFRVERMVFHLMHSMVESPVHRVYYILNENLTGLIAVAMIVSSKRSYSFKFFFKKNNIKLRHKH